MGGRCVPSEARLCDVQILEPQGKARQIDVPIWSSARPLYAERRKTKCMVPLTNMQQVLSDYAGKPEPPPLVIAAWLPYELASFQRWVSGVAGLTIFWGAP